MAADKSTAWWDAPKNQKHDHLWKWVSYCARQNRTLRMDTRLFVEAVSNFNPTGNSDFSVALRSALPYKIRDNILQAGRDTVVSMIAQARTAPQYLTTAAEWSLSRVAEQRSRVLQGQMYSLQVFRIVPQCFGDACDGGTGFVVGRVIRDSEGNPRPELERCLHNEVLWDPEDARYGKPRRIAWVHFVDRAKLLKEHKGKEAAIKDAAGPNGQDILDFWIQRSNKSDQVRVVEAWTLPTSEGAGDGLYVKSTSAGTLDEKPYKRMRLPIVPVRYAQRAQGYAGQSLTERLLPAQMRLCEIDDYIAKSQRLGSNSKWFAYRNSGITRDDFTNAPDQVLEVAAPELTPQHVTNVGTPPDLAQQRDAIKIDAFNQEGIGDNASTGDVNKGLSSARAVRAAVDVRSQRFITPARLLEFAYMDVVRLIEDLNDECSEIDKNYSPEARYRSGRRTWLKRVPWKKLSLGEHDAQCQMFPISAQSQTPQAKWSETEEWIDRGFMSKPMAMDLMEFPDVEAFEQLENANLDLIREQVENIIDLEGAREDLLLPIPEQGINGGFELAAYIVTNAALQAFKLNAPSDVMERFDAYLTHVQELQKQAKVGQSAPAAASLDQGAAAAAQAQLAQNVNGPVGQA